MQAVVLSPSQGIRLRPLIVDNPKVLGEEVLWEEANRYGVLDTNEYSENVELVEMPEDPPTSS